MWTRKSLPWPGPQLVVPLTNARFALNAANARWGSLYDALYGTDADPTGRRTRGWQGLQCQARRQGDRIRARRAGPAAPLASGSWKDITGISVEGGALKPALKDPSQFKGTIGDAASPSTILLGHNGLHIEVPCPTAAM